jgi:hypothetical protein
MGSKVSGSAARNPAPAAFGVGADASPDPPQAVAKSEITPSHARIELRDRG